MLINITGGPDLMLFEVEQAANRIRAEVDPDANIIFGNTILDDMEGRIRVSVVATGIDAEQMRMPREGPAAASAPASRCRCSPNRSRNRASSRVRPWPRIRCIASIEALADELGAQMPARARRRSRR